MCSSDLSFVNAVDQGTYCKDCKRIKTSKLNFIKHDLNIPAIDIDLDVPDEGDTTIKRITSELSKAGFKNIKVFPALLDSRVRGLFQPIAKNIPGLFLNAHLLDETTVFQARKLKQA